MLVIKNSKSEKYHTEEFSGIGLENTRKRLALIYGSNFQLDIVDDKDLFTVNLSIPL